MAVTRKDEGMPPWLPFAIAASAVIAIAAGARSGWKTSADQPPPPVPPPPSPGLQDWFGAGLRI